MRESAHFSAFGEAIFCIFRNLKTAKNYLLVSLKQCLEIRKCLMVWFLGCGVFLVFCVVVLVFFVNVDVQCTLLNYPASTRDIGQNDPGSSLGLARQQNLPNHHRHFC